MKKEEEKIKLELTKEQLNLIVQTLSKKPWFKVNDTLASISLQINK